MNYQLSSRVWYISSAHLPYVALLLIPPLYSLDFQSLCKKISNLIFHNRGVEGEEQHYARQTVRTNVNILKESLPPYMISALSGVVGSSLLRVPQTSLVHQFPDRSDTLVLVTSDETLGPLIT